MGRNIRLLDCVCVCVCVSVFEHATTCHPCFLHRVDPQTCNTSTQSSPTSQWHPLCATLTPWWWPAASGRRQEPSLASPMAHLLTTTSCKGTYLCLPHFRPREHRARGQREERTQCISLGIHNRLEHPGMVMAWTADKKSDMLILWIWTCEGTPTPLHYWKWCKECQVNKK